MMNLLSQFTPLFAAAEAQSLGIGWNIYFYSVLTIVAVMIFATLTRAGLNPKGAPKNLAAKLAEHLVLFIEQMALDVIGPHGRKYLPFLISIWIFIFPANVFSLIFGPSPTADWSMNLGMAIVTVLYVQWEGIKTNGIFGHLRHFAGPKLPGILLLVSGLIFMVEIVSECMKLVSLSLRLFGNIEGGHIVKESLDSILHFHLFGGDVFVPFGGLLLPIKFFTCVIQAFVWTILACVYLGAVTAHEHDEEHEGSTAVEKAILVAAS